MTQDITEDYYAALGKAIARTSMLEGAIHDRIMQLSGMEQGIGMIFTSKFTLDTAITVFEELFTVRVKLKQDEPEQALKKLKQWTGKASKIRKERNKIAHAYFYGQPHPKNPKRKVLRVRRLSGKNNDSGKVEVDYPTKNEFQFLARDADKLSKELEDLMKVGGFE